MKNCPLAPILIKKIVKIINNQKICLLVYFKIIVTIKIHIQILIYQKTFSRT